MFARTKLATAAVTGVLSLAVTGAAAFAAFQPGSDTAIVAATDSGGATALQAERERPERVKHGIKEILDRLVQNGTITQAQEEAILKALKEAGEHKGDREGAHVLKHVLADLMRLAADYLGLGKEQLGEQLKAGKTLGEIANATTGKSREGLIAYDVAQVSAQLDKAVADGKITKERADEAKKGLVEHVTSFVDHKREHKPVPPRERTETQREKPAPSPTAKPTT